MQEQRVEERLREEVRKIGGKAYKLSSQIEAGMPDRLVCLPGGKAIFVETKRPKGGRLSAIQKYRHKDYCRTEVALLCNYAYRYSGVKQQEQHMQRLVHILLIAREVVAEREYESQLQYL